MIDSTSGANNVEVVQDEDVICEASEALSNITKGCENPFDEIWFEPQVSGVGANNVIMVYTEIKEEGSDGSASGTGIQYDFGTCIDSNFVVNGGWATDVPSVVPSKMNSDVSRTVIFHIFRAEYCDQWSFSSQPTLDKELARPSLSIKVIEPNTPEITTNMSGFISGSCDWESEDGFDLRHCECQVPAGAAYCSSPLPRFYVQTHANVFSENLALRFIQYDDSGHVEDDDCSDSEANLFDSSNRNRLDDIAAGETHTVKIYTTQSCDPLNEDLEELQFNLQLLQAVVDHTL
jgi:hypothetical protein